jgi:hypothetical protein
MFHLNLVHLACLVCLVLVPATSGADSRNDDELIKAALTHARAGGFDLAFYKRNISMGPSFFHAFARAAQNSNGQESLYLAQDMLTKNFEEIHADLRSASVNNVMVYLQMGIIGGLLKKYGAPGRSGQHGTDLVYALTSDPAGEMSNVDACALSTAFSIYYNSFMHSTLEDRHVFAINEYFDKQCRAIGFESCAEIDMDRRQCDGHFATSAVAERMVTQVNSSW